MAQLTPELQQAYSDAIQILFGGVVESTPDDINDAVVDDIDTMIVSIAQCSKEITELGFKAIYTVSLNPLIGFVLNDILKLSAQQAYPAKRTINYILKKWVEALTNNNQFAGCLYQARANWRSTVTIDLLGI